MKLIIIAALNRKRVIGKDGKIPWHIPEDLQRFKALTMGHTVLMGRKTYESIGKILSGRRNVVITSQNLPDVEHHHSIDEALDAVKGDEKVFVIGGGEIFRQTIDRADELLLTIVENEEDGDVFFPLYQDHIGKSLTLTNVENHQGFEFQTYKKNKK